MMVTCGYDSFIYILISCRNFGDEWHSLIGSYACKFLRLERSSFLGARALRLCLFSSCKNPAASTTNPI
jgi:hypothetical protein